MWFEYKFRDKTGGVKTASAEAPSRTDLIAMLKAQGITPVSIRESPGGISSRKILADLGGRRTFYVAMALAAMVVIGLGVWLFTPSRDLESRNASSKVGVVKPPRPSRLAPKAPKSEGHPPPSAVTNQPEAKAAPSVPQESNKVVHAVSASRKERIVHEDGTVTWEKVKPVFKNQFDTMVYAAVRPGGMASGLKIMLMRHTDEEIIAMLKAPVEPGREESPEYLERKKLTEDFKARILEYVKQGNTLGDAIAEMETVLRAERVGRAAAERNLRKLMREGTDPEVVRTFVEEQNRELRAKGMRELTLPGRLREEAQNNGGSPATGKAPDSNSEEDSK